MQNIFGVISNGVHIDVSNTLKGAKNYATRNGFNTVIVRYNCGYIVETASMKIDGKWINSLTL